MIEQPTTTIDLFSWASYYIELRFDENKLAIGTCFFISRNGKIYLITNWHNVTGQNPITLEFLEGKISFPNNLNVYFVDRNKHKINVGYTNVGWTGFNVKLLDDNDMPLWIEHPIHKNRVDVVAIEVDVPENLVMFPIEKVMEPHNENTNVKIGNDVFILGFPFGNTGGGLFPIWKRASIASEPNLDIDKLPKMFVDTASRPGMSGSPVILKEKRAVMIFDEGNSSRYFTKLVDIYSGRIGADDELKAQLGVIWKSSVLDEIINQ